MACHLCYDRSEIFVEPSFVQLHRVWQNILTPPCSSLYIHSADLSQIETFEHKAHQHAQHCSQ